MTEIRELRELIEDTNFELTIVEMNDYQTLLRFSTSKCVNGLFLDIRLVQEWYTYITVDLCYGNDSYRVLDKYIIEGETGVISLLSKIISNTVFADKSLGNDISILETNIMLAPSVEWIDIFKSELINIFKDFDVDRTENLVVHLIGVDFIVKFNEDTNSFSVEVVQTSNPDNSKVLLLGVVCDNNYNKVLSAIKHTFKEAMNRFNKLESISLKIMWGK